MYKGLYNSDKYSDDEMREMAMRNNNERVSDPEPKENTKSNMRKDLFTEEELEKGYHKMARKRNGILE